MQKMYKMSLILSFQEERSQSKTPGIMSRGPGGADARGWLESIGKDKR